MGKHPKRSRPNRADRALCPPEVSNRLGIPIREVAKTMGAAGVSERLTVQQAVRWTERPDIAPDWFTELVADNAARRARREHQKQQQELERQHRDLLLRDKVEQKLLAGRLPKKHSDEETLYADAAFRAMKDLVRVGGDTDSLTALDLAALRWAGVTPGRHETWFIHGAGCCPEDRERQHRDMRKALHQARSWVNPPVKPDRYVADTATEQWCTRTVLRLRGWTDAAMRDYLPEPEGHKRNPHYATAHPMPAWSAATIGRIERTEQWQQWLTRSLRRRRIDSVQHLRRHIDDRLTAKLEAVERCIRREQDQP